MRFAYFWVWLRPNVRDVPCGLFTFGYGRGQMLEMSHVVCLLLSFMRSLVEEKNQDVSCDSVSFDIIEGSS